MATVIYIAQNKQIINIKIEKHSKETKKDLPKVIKHNGTAIYNRFLKKRAIESVCCVCFCGCGLAIIWAFSSFFFVVVF